MGTFDTTKRWNDWNGDDDEPVSSSRRTDERSSGVVETSGGGAAPADVPSSDAAPVIGEGEGARASASWFADTYERHRRLVWAKIRRMLPDVAPQSVDGIHQEVFFAMHQQVQEKKALPDSPSGMLFAITRHQVSNYLRVRARRRRLAKAAEVVAEASSDADVTDARIAEKMLVHEVLAKLPPDAADLIRWIDLDGMGHDEVAEMLGRPVDTVKTRHRRARDRFEEVLKRLCRKEVGGGA